jgi:membrane associated rhomboid family serine protease
VKVWLPSAVLLALASALVLAAVGVPSSGAALGGLAIGLLLAVPVAALIVSRRRPGR